MVASQEYARKGMKYSDGELEVILSLVPTEQNIAHLSALLQRSPESIEIVYRIAYQHGDFGKSAKIQEQKILAAKQKLGIVIGRTTNAKR